MSTTREIRLPALSATMTEAVLLEWKVAVGDSVRQGQPIAEVSTDKVDMDLEAPFDGVIETLDTEPGMTVALGGLMATAATESEDLLGGLDLGGGSTPAPAEAAATTEAEQPVPTEEPGATPRPSGIVPASPPARKMARELGVELEAVTPSGARGQVTPLDVKRHAEATSLPEAPTAQAPTAPVAPPEPPKAP
ncbi:MAG: biotin/lipoyl-containing protein, partial [Acidimicrobiia bacterium]